MEHACGWDIPVCLGIVHPSGGRQVFWGYPDIRAKPLKWFLKRGGHDAPFLITHSVKLDPQKNYCWFRAEEFATKMIFLCHKELPVLTSPISCSQYTILPGSTLNFPVFICCLHGSLTQKSPSALKPKLIPGLLITISLCDNISHLFKLLLFLLFLPLFLLSVFVESNLVLPQVSLYCLSVSSYLGLFF